MFSRYVEKGKPMKESQRRTGKNMGGGCWGSQGEVFQGQGQMSPSLQACVSSKWPEEFEDQSGAGTGSSEFALKRMRVILLRRWSLREAAAMWAGDRVERRVKETRLISSHWHLPHWVRDKEETHTLFPDFFFLLNKVNHQITWAKSPLIKYPGWIF